MTLTVCNLRPAMKDDLPEILKWRNDPVTRYFRPDPRIIEPDEHERWFLKMGTTSFLYIFEHKGYPAGQIKLDYENHAYEFGWIVKPCLRGMGIGKRMVKAALEIPTNHRRWCKMRWDNVGSYAIAVANNFHFVRSDGNMLVLEHD